MERPRLPFESEPQKFPTQDEILEVFGRITGGRQFDIATPKVNEHGEIAFLTMGVVNSDGTREEFQYVRMDDAPVIVVADIDRNDTVTPLIVLAEYTNGSWMMKEGVIRTPTV